MVAREREAIGSDPEVAQGGLRIPPLGPTLQWSWCCLPPSSGAVIDARSRGEDTRFRSQDRVAPLPDSGSHAEDVRFPSQDPRLPSPDS